MQEIICDACGQLTPRYNIVHCKSEGGDYRPFCNRCLNAKAAHLVGLERFEDIQFQPVVLSDVRGERHEFHFRTHLFGTGVALDAFELRDGNPLVMDSK